MTTHMKSYLFSLDDEHDSVEDLSELDQDLDELSTIAADETDQ